MSIYSPLPPEMIWEGWEDFKPVWQEIKVNGRILQVEMQGFNQARVVRLLSTDPADYLNSAYQPGCILSFSPQQSTNPGAINDNPPV